MFSHCSSNNVCCSTVKKNSQEISESCHFSFCVNLRNVVVLVGVVLVPFHIVSVDERFDSFLEIWRLHRELELVVEFGDQEVVRQRFSHFHDPNDGRVNLVLAILEDSFLRRLLLFRRFFQLHLIDFDVVQLQTEEKVFDCYE